MKSNKTKTIATRLEKRGLKLLSKEFIAALEEAKEYKTVKAAIAITSKERGLVLRILDTVLRSVENKGINTKISFALKKEELKRISSLINKLAYKK
jgi:hypothetical protein